MDFRQRVAYQHVVFQVAFAANGPQHLEHFQPGVDLLGDFLLLVFADALSGGGLLDGEINPRRGRVDQGGPIEPDGGGQRPVGLLNTPPTASGVDFSSRSVWSSDAEITNASSETAMLGTIFSSTPHSLGSGKA